MIWFTIFTISNYCTKIGGPGPGFSERRHFFSELLGYVKKRWYFCKKYRE